MTAPRERVRLPRMASNYMRLTALQSPADRAMAEHHLMALILERRGTTFDLVQPSVDLLDAAEIGGINGAHVEGLLVWLTRRGWLEHLADGVLRVTDDGVHAPVRKLSPIAEPWLSCPESQYRAEFLRSFLEELREWGLRSTRVASSHASSEGGAATFEAIRVGQLRSHFNKHVGDARRFIADASVGLDSKDLLGCVLGEPSLIDSVADAVERAVSFYDRSPNYAGQPPEWILDGPREAWTRLRGLGLAGFSTDPDTRGALEAILDPTVVVTEFGSPNTGRARLSWTWMIEKAGEEFPIDEIALGQASILNVKSGFRVPLSEVPRLFGRQVTDRGLAALRTIDADSDRRRAGLAGQPGAPAIAASSKSTRCKVLLLAANPDEDLQLNEEVRAVQEAIQASEHREHIELIPRIASRPRDLLRAIIDLRPPVVHFSGHGDPQTAIYLQDDAGDARPVTGEALRKVFAAARDVRVVVLASCYSAAQAEAIRMSVDCVIGMEHDFGDLSARAFSSAFYGALASGRSVADAFDLGRASIAAEGLDDDATPKLLVRDGVDASSLILVPVPARSD